VKLSIQRLAGWLTIGVLSAAAIRAVVYVAAKVPSQDYAPVAGLVGTASTLLAAIWFTATLIYQSRQLAEQRQQFALSFEQSRRDARREALVVADGILRDGENAALSMNPDFKSIGDISAHYIELGSMATMLKSTNPTEVMEAGKEWLKREGPALTLVRAVESAFKVYTDLLLDSSLPSEEFVSIDGPHFWYLPYFQRYHGVVSLLTDFMVNLGPGRKAALIAHTIAIGLSTNKDLLKRDKILKDIEELRQKNYAVPAIAEEF
jgi:hypothetical protein